MTDVEPRLSDDPVSTQFGATEGLDAFNMARSSGAEHRLETLEELAQDAVMTAMRFRRDAEQPQRIDDIDPTVATAALVTTVLENLHH